MKIITVAELERRFDEVMEDVELNKEHYRIQNDDGDVMLIPYDSFDVLHDVYLDWVDQPKAEVTD